MHFLYWIFSWWVTRPGWHEFNFAWLKSVIQLYVCLSLTIALDHGFAAGGAPLVVTQEDCLVYMSWRPSINITRQYRPRPTVPILRLSSLFILDLLIMQGPSLLGWRVSIPVWSCWGGRGWVVSLLPTCPVGRGGCKLGPLPTWLWKGASTLLLRGGVPLSLPPPEKKWQTPVKTLPSSLLRTWSVNIYINVIYYGCILSKIFFDHITNKVKLEYWLFTQQQDFKQLYFFNDNLRCLGKFIANFSHI